MCFHTFSSFHIAIHVFKLHSLVDYLTVWRAGERFFVKYFSFLFDNTSPCHLCVCVSLPLLFHINCCCVVINYGLELFIVLCIACTYHSEHLLFEYKLVSVKFNLGIWTFIGVLYAYWTFQAKNFSKKKRMQSSTNKDQKKIQNNIVS